MGQTGRNDLCHFGSGKKYKKCCLQKDEEEALRERAIQHSASSIDEFLPAFEPSPEDSSAEPANMPEDENITKLWADLKHLHYPEDISSGLSIIESFIKEFPNLVQASEVIDEVLEIEGVCFDLGASKIIHCFAGQS